MNALAGVAHGHQDFWRVDVMHLNLHRNVFDSVSEVSGQVQGPVLVKKSLAPLSGYPTIVLVEKEGRLSLDLNRAQSIGRVRAFVGNLAVLDSRFASTRWLTVLGSTAGHRRCLIVNANNIRKKLEDVFASCRMTRLRCTRWFSKRCAAKAA